MTSYLVESVDQGKLESILESAAARARRLVMADLAKVSGEFRVLLRSLESDSGAFDWDEALQRVEARLGDLNRGAQDPGRGPQVEKICGAIPYVGKLLHALREKQPAEAIGHTAKVIEWLEGPDPAQEGEMDARWKAGHR